MTVAPPEQLAVPVIDTHCHLDIHDQHLHGGALPDPDTLIELAASVGVTRIVQIGCDLESARLSIALARTRPSLVVGVGLHPNEAPRIFVDEGREALEAAYLAIEEMAADDVVRAVGETGLDYFRTEEELRPIQQESFRRHIGIAKKLNKTLVIHDRESHQDVIDILMQEGAPQRVVFHCFSGDAAMARLCAEQGWFISFAGVVTFKPAQELRDAAAVVPDELILVETDAPYLTPAPHRGKPNASYLMPHTVRTLAQVRGTDESALGALLWANAQRAFGIW
ncbi:MAG: TatD family hydrolase [Actinomycetota bacterium]|nr:TatD family hydrolase [Actinomycetota bacterium]